MNQDTELGGPVVSVSSDPAGQPPGAEAQSSLVPGSGAKLHSILNYWFSFSTVRSPGIKLSSLSSL